MIERFDLSGAPESNLEASSHNIEALVDFNSTQIGNIGKALNSLGMDFDQLKNLFVMAEEDKLDTSAFVGRLSILAGHDTPIELKAHIKSWQESL